MAIQYNENIKIAGPLPLDTRYLSLRTLGGNPLPYSGASEVYSTIISSERYSGLTVLINTGGTNLEYWFKNNTTNLILKSITGQTTADAITGATNLGFFSGQTGVQTLPIDHQTNNNYDGNYQSLYNWYYRGIDAVIHTGTPSDGIPKRGYVKSAYPNTKSWIWNEYVGGGNLLGWILIDGNISNLIGQQIAVTGDAVYYTGATGVYTQTSWFGTPPTNGSYVTINTIVGSLLTGNTITIGGPPYAKEVDQELQFRTIISDTPDNLTIGYDESFIHLSGTTGNALITASNGLTKIGTNVTLGGTLTGTTIITDVRTGSTAVGIQYAANYSANFTDRSLIDKGYLNTISSFGGERIYKTICQTSHGFNVGEVVGFSGCTYNKPIATGTYDGEVLGVVSKCFNVDCFELTQAGFVTGITVGGGLVINNTYFLSATVAGCLTACEPTTPNYLSKSMFIATSNGSCGCGWVLPYAGYVITSGITNGGALVKNVCLPTISTYSMNNGDFFVGMSGGSTVILPTTPLCGMVVVIADISNTALSYPITIVGSIVGCTSTSQIDTNSGSLSYIFNGTRWNVFAFAPALT
jgi:hypothetical protein